MTPGQNSTLNYDPGENYTLNCDPNPRSQFNLGSQFNVESRPGVTIQRWIMTRGHNSTWNLDPGHNSTLNHDSGSQFNVELRPGVIIQRTLKTRGHNSIGGQDFIRRRGRNTMTPSLGGRNSTWKIHWILTADRWIKTPRVEIQWGQNSILHRRP